MVLKRGRNVGDRPIRETSESEILQLIVSGRPDHPLTADEARAKTSDEGSQAR
jgi:ABC-type sugar transport system ATPase subunit